MRTFFKNYTHASVCIMQYAQSFSLLKYKRQNRAILHSIASREAFFEEFQSSIRETTLAANAARESEILTLTLSSASIGRDTTVRTCSTITDVWLYHQPSVAAISALNKYTKK